MKLRLDNDQTLLEALTVLSPDSSKTTLRSWLKEGVYLSMGLLRNWVASLLKSIRQ